MLMSITKHARLARCQGGFNNKLQCSELLPVRLPEADNFGGGPWTFWRFSSMLNLWFEIKVRRIDNFFDWVFEHWTNVTICEFTGNGSIIPIELCIAVAEAAVGMTSRLYVNEIRWRRPGVSMTVCQAGPTGVIKRTHTLSRSQKVRFLRRNTFGNHNHRCAWFFKA